MAEVTAPLAPRPCRRVCRAAAACSEISFPVSVADATRALSEASPAAVIPIWTEEVVVGVTRAWFEGAVVGVTHVGLDDRRPQLTAP